MARRVQGLLRGDMQGHRGHRDYYGGMRRGMYVVAEPRGEQKLGAYGPAGCRLGGHMSPKIAGLGGTRPRRLQDRPTLSSYSKRLSGTETPRNEAAVWQGSRVRRGTMDRRVTWGSQATRVPAEYCR